MYVKRTAVMRADEVSAFIKCGCQDGENGAHKFFTETEMAYCAERMNCLGARFIIKKCVLDYLACEKGYQGNNYREIEIMNNEMGRPLIRVIGDVHECVQQLHIKDMLISISHSKHWVTGMVLFCYEA